MHAEAFGAVAEDDAVRFLMKVRASPSGASVVTLEREKPVIEIAFADGTVRVFRGVPPVWLIVHLLLFGVVGAVATAVFLYAFVAVAVSCFHAFQWKLPALAFVMLAIGVFGLFVLSRMVRIAFPYRAELDVRNGVLTIRNGLRRSRYAIGAGSAFVVEPVTTRGDWGYAVCIRSDGKSRDFVPPVFVGPRRRSLRQGMETASLIQGRVPTLAVEQSKRW